MIAASAQDTTTTHQTDIATGSFTLLPSQNDSAIPSPLMPTSTRSTVSPVPLTSSRGRSTNRYPDSLGRVPLHRRGTSKTYERLEDLLREAGYKETRVFTPETDRVARSTEKHDGGVGNSMRGSVGAVVDFITGLVNRGSSFSPETAPLKDDSTQAVLHAWPPPPLPSAHTLHIGDDRVKRVPPISPLSRNGSSESIRRHTYVDVSAGTSQRIHTYQVVQLHQSSQGLPHHPHTKHRSHQQQLNNRRHHQLNYSSKSTSTKPNPPNARAYLRHMASAPNIQPLAKRPSISESPLRPHVASRKHRNGMRQTFILNDEDSIAESDYESHARVTIGDDERQLHPPLPRNWIDSVAKALLSGVAGPAAVTSDTVSTRTVGTASTWKSTALSDRSNREERGRAQVRGSRPPFLCVQVQDMKGRTSEGQVACTRVMCRSTPTSRTSSRARNSAHEDHMNIMNSGKRTGGTKSGNRRRGKDREAVVPSLARTKVENDEWMAPRQRYLGGWGVQGSAQAYPDGTWSEDSDGDDDEEDEGELDLDRLLVPARRQHSIQSLRKHLQRPPSRVLSHHLTPHSRSPRSGRSSPFGGSPAARLDWGDASWSTNRSREWLASRGEEDEDGYGHAFPTTSSSSTKWRRGLPVLPQWTASS